MKALFKVFFLSLTIVASAAVPSELPISREKLLIYADQKARSLQVNVSANAEADRKAEFQVPLQNARGIERLGEIKLDFQTYNPAETVYVNGVISDERGWPLFRAWVATKPQPAKGGGYSITQRLEFELEENGTVPIKVSNFEYAEVYYLDADGKERSEFIEGLDEDDWGDGWDDLMLFPTRLANATFLVMLHTHDKDGHHITAFNGDGVMIGSTGVNVSASFGLKDLKTRYVLPSIPNLALEVPSQNGVGQNRVFFLLVFAALDVTVTGQTTEGAIPLKLVVQTENGEEQTYDMVDGSVNLSFPGPGGYYAYFIWGENFVPPPPPSNEGGKGNG